MSDKLRVDQALVRQGLASSREKAQALIMAGQVYRREVKVLKPSEKVEEGEALTVRGHAHPFVGRGALKLDKALRVFGADVRDTVAMDIGAATGGFTDVLLHNGARHVYAIDVGYGQLDWKIRNDARVTVLERTNARYLTHAEVPCVPDITVMDVSFISVRLILPVAAELMEHRGGFTSLSSRSLRRERKTWERRALFATHAFTGRWWKKSPLSLPAFATSWHRWIFRRSRGRRVISNISQNCFPTRPDRLR